MKGLFNLMRQAGLPEKIPASLDVNDLRGLMSVDKKVSHW